MACSGCQWHDWQLSLLICYGCSEAQVKKKQFCPTHSVHFISIFAGFVCQDQVDVVWLNPRSLGAIHISMLALAWLLTSLACCPCFRINSQNPAWDIVDEIQNKNGAEICRILQQEYRDQLQSNETVFEVVMEAFREETNMKHVALLRCLEEAVNISLSTVRSPYDETLLFPAARSGRLKALEYLIAKGVPLNEINKDGYSAAEEGIVHKKCPQCLSKLLGAGVKPDQASLRPCSSFSKRIFVCSAGRTLAHFAAQHNAPESLEVLQEHGANLSALDDAGFSPAHVAVRHMELEALKELGKLNASAAPSFFLKASDSLSGFFRMF